MLPPLSTAQSLTTRITCFAKFSFFLNWTVCFPFFSFKFYECLFDYTNRIPQGARSKKSDFWSFAEHNVRLVGLVVLLRVSFIGTILVVSL